MLTRACSPPAQIRLLRVKRLLRRFQGQAGGQVLRVAVILGFWLLVSHWFACGFVLVGWNVRLQHGWGWPRGLGGGGRRLPLLIAVI